MGRYIFVGTLTTGLIVALSIACVPEEQGINQCRETYKEVSEEDFERLRKDCGRVGAVNEHRVPESTISATYEVATRIDTIDVSDTNLETLHTPELTRTDEITCWDNDSFVGLDAPNLSQIGDGESMNTELTIDGCPAWTTIELPSLETVSTNSSFYDAISLTFTETPLEGTVTVRFHSLEYIDGGLNIQIDDQAGFLEVVLEFPELREMTGNLKIKASDREDSSQLVRAKFGALETVGGRIDLPGVERLDSHESMFRSLAFCDFASVGSIASEDDRAFKEKLDQKCGI